MGKIFKPFSSHENFNQDYSIFLGHFYKQKGTKKTPKLSFLEKILHNDTL